MFVAAQLF